MWSVPLQLKQLWLLLPSYPRNVDIRDTQILLNSECLLCPQTPLTFRYTHIYHDVHSKSIATIIYSYHDFTFHRCVCLKFNWIKRSQWPIIPEVEVHFIIIYFNKKHYFLKQIRIPEQNEIISSPNLSDPTKSLTIASVVSGETVARVLMIPVEFTYVIQ